MSIEIEPTERSGVYVARCSGRIGRAQVGALSTSISDLAARGKLRAMTIDAREIELDESESLAAEVWEDWLTALPANIRLAYLGPPEFASRRENMVRQMILDAERDVEIFDCPKKADGWLHARLMPDMPAA